MCTNLWFLCLRPKIAFDCPRVITLFTLILLGLWFALKGTYPTALSLEVHHFPRHNWLRACILWKMAPS